MGYDALSANALKGNVMEIVEPLVVLAPMWKAKVGLTSERYVYWVLLMMYKEFVSSYVRLKEDSNMSQAAAGK